MSRSTLNRVVELQTVQRSLELKWAILYSKYSCSTTMTTSATPKSMDQSKRQAKRKPVIQQQRLTLWHTKDIYEHTEKRHLMPSKFFDQKRRELLLSRRSCHFRPRFPFTKTCLVLRDIEFGRHKSSTLALCLHIALRHHHQITVVMPLLRCVFRNQFATCSDETSLVDMKHI